MSNGRKEHQQAIGGMKNPRISLHLVFGSSMRTWMSSPDMQDRMHAAIGDAAKRNKGPTQEQIQGLTKRVEDYFGINPECRARCSLTQLHQPIDHAWVERAGDPDIYVVIWLQQGAPIGIPREAEPAGIFSTSAPDKTSRR